MVTIGSDVESVPLCVGADEVLHTGTSIVKQGYVDTVDSISSETTTCSICDVGYCLYLKGSVSAGTVGEELHRRWA